MNICELLPGYNCCLLAPWKNKCFEIRLSLRYSRGDVRRILWSLELASEVFHDFFAIFSLMILAGKIRLQPSLQGRNSRKNTVARDARLERNFAPRKGISISRDWKGIWNRGRVVWSRRTRTLE